eukprot:6209300-Pleurochrysis_carterae.AAC.4
MPWQRAFEAARSLGLTKAEKNARADSLAQIRKKLGEAGESLITMLLTFDSLSAFCRVMRVRIGRSRAKRKEHAVACVSCARASLLAKQFKSSLGGDSGGSCIKANQNCCSHHYGLLHHISLGW